ncbi:MAG: NUDIX domain-containing protein [Euryarchaeota archaeon]|nr:NUDIX domain-containing protein [Euryarchaeota archaeon]
MYRLGCKAWLERDGRFVLSEGRAALLRAVGRRQSLREAAAGLGISYRHAWAMLRRTGQAAGEPVIRSERGGKGRGRTVLTEAGERALRAYDSELGRLQRTRGPWLTVDAVIEREGALLLVRRGRPPFEGMHALPGGFVEAGETVEEAVVREVREETGLRTRVAGLLGVYSDPERDPRGHTVSAVFVLEATGGRLRGGDDAAEAAFFDIGKLPPLAFDHDRVVTDYLKTHRA